jgi:TetR/AcrR family transcriptional regulator, regulator of autoinduction and epiphytic fitness
MTRKKGAPTLDVHLSDIATAAVPTNRSPAFAFPSMPPDEPPRDGRVARSHRTIEHIVEALLELLERDGDLRPTAHQVARRAGVSRRALYLHFDSLEELFATATERRVREICGAWETPPLDAPVNERIDWFATRWASLLETLSPLRRAAALHEPFSKQVSDTLDQVRRWARDTVELTFLPELSACSDDERANLATALHHVTSSHAWDDIRRQGTDVQQARQALQRLLRALLLKPELTPTD